MVGQHVREADLGVRLQSEVLTEGAIAVDANSRGQRESLVPANLLLQEEAGVDLTLAGVRS